MYQLGLNTPQSIILRALTRVESVTNLGYKHKYIDYMSKTTAVGISRICELPSHEFPPVE